VIAANVGARGAPPPAADVVRTPVVTIPGARLGLPGTLLTLKLEFLQTSGAFKYRGALNHVAGPGRGGVVTVSSGNHGVALATAGRAHGVRVVVVLAPGANPWRRARIAALDAEVRVAPSAGEAFGVATDIAAREGLHFVHPYDSAETFAGTASLGAEFAAQAPDLDAVIVAIGGGGLAAGVAAAMRARIADLKVYGVEPDAAPTMTAAFATGRPVAVSLGPTVADSLAAPIAGPTAFAQCREHLAGIVTVADSAIVAAMRELYLALRLAVEPSAAAGLAALAGPLREALTGRHVGLILCGANQDPVAQCAMLREERP